MNHFIPRDQKGFSILELTICLCICFLLTYLPQTQLRKLLGHSAQKTTKEFSLYCDALSLAAKRNASTINLQYDAEQKRFVAQSIADNSLASFPLPTQVEITDFSFGNLNSSKAAISFYSKGNTSAGHITFKDSLDNSCSLIQSPVGARRISCLAD